MVLICRAVCLTDIPWEDLFKLGVSIAAADKFYELIQTGIDVYIPCNSQILQ